MDTPDEVQCPCCHIDYPRHDPPVFAPRRVALHPHHGLCWDCMTHQGTDAEATHARGRQHGQMLRREYAEARRQRDDALAREEDMRHELAQRPVRVVVRTENLDKIVVASARSERDEAYRKRDVAMGALSDVRMHHHRDPDNKDFCSCKALYRKCDMAQIADRWEGVEWWEQSQAGRAYKGRKHYLDPEHPALTDRDWFKEVYGA